MDWLNNTTAYGKLLYPETKSCRIKYWLVSHSGRIEGFNLLQWVIIELIHLFLISLLSATRSIQNMVFNQTDQVFFCDFFADQENRIKTLISDSDFNEVKKVCDGIKREEYLYSGRRF